jgi:hypothetical protein
MHPIAALVTDRSYPHHLMGDAAPQARARLKRLMNDRELPVPKRGDPDLERVIAESFFDWEPLEVLVDMTQARDVRSVGGAPQVVRIYQYGEAEAFVWRTASGTDYFGGRPIQNSERFDRRILTLTDEGMSTSFSDHSTPSG